MAAPLPSRSGFALAVDLLRMEPESFGFDRAKGANDHIEQGDAALFARDAVSFT